MPDTQSKVAFIWETRKLFGAEQRFLAMARALNARGQPAIVLLEEDDARGLERFVTEPIPNLLSFRWPWWVRVALRGSERLPRLWKAFGVGYFYRKASKHFLAGLRREHGIGLWHISMSSRIPPFLSGPVLFEVTSPDWADRLVAEPGLLPASMVLHAVSASVAERLRRGLPDRRIIEAPMPFPNLDPAAEPLPDMGGKENLIVFAHRFIPRKNGLLFARVARRFLRTHPDWRIAFRGIGPQATAIQEVVADEIRAGRVTVGYNVDLRAELRRARLFVSIIEPDNYPSQAIIEAMTCGNALLLSDLGRTREKFFDGNGLMTEIDEDRVLASLTTLVGDPARLDAMGLRSYALVSERFSQDAYLAHLVCVYADLGFSAGAPTRIDGVAPKAA